MESFDYSDEELRKILTDRIYAAAVAGMPAMILDIDKIQRADSEELREIARRNGVL